MEINPTKPFSQMAIKCRMSKASNDSLPVLLELSTPTYIQRLNATLIISSEKQDTGTAGGFKKRNPKDF
jgi:hypothetical protein